ncbi:MAG: Inositol 2-dehydrogenase [Planctomycetes bacterium ADurb.Bin126]|nr:MAG: Inositol 2-dehydrogenase [Planctomycetes bacterium ADurb.Bin126]HOD83088.1 Gfo/Idh/MocA family oxidoreductase [Phycisphaerae bacterium]HQL73499.1 Gfo/Idh/MocA family oxidoreductase [Phycisphaerae bacterium]
MATTTRRAFLQQSATLAAGAAVASSARAAENDKIVLGVIGPGGMGSNLLASFASMGDVVVSHVCDVDARRMAAAAKRLRDKTGKDPKAVKDMRRIFDDKSVDAVVIATPDHWHAPATILACDAGKHVYVEKPCSHNLREGRLMVEAARRNKRIVQVGMQSRSADYLAEGIELLKSGAIGEVLVAKVWNSQLRANIGHKQPSQPPEHLDYDLWVGPSPMVPYRSNMLPSSWRWFRNFGTGDMGNDGVHDLDLARWGLGVEVQPTRVAALGGKYFFDDDQEFPDTQTVAFEYDLGDGKKKQLIYEQRIWSPYFQQGAENGDAFYGTKGYMLLAKHAGWQLFGPRDKPLQKLDGRLDGTPHHRNFLECIRSGKQPNADVEIGHLSASLTHLGNIATQTGRTLTLDPRTERIIKDDQSDHMLRRQYRDHWAVPKNA